MKASTGRPASGARRWGPTLALALALGGCGKKGPPLPPLEVTPEAVRDLVLVQWGEELVVFATLPARYRDGEPFHPARIEVRMLTEEAAPRPVAATPPPLPSPPPLALPTIRADAQVEPVVRRPTGLADRSTPVSSGTPIAALPGATLEVPVVDEARARRAQALGSRFEREARRARDVILAQEPEALVAGNRFVVSLPIPAAPGRMVAAGIRVRGLRKGDGGESSNVVTIERGEAAPPPPPPVVENVDGGMRIGTGASAGAPVAVYRAGAGGKRFLPVPVGGAPATTAEVIDSSAGLGERVCYVVARVLDPAVPGVMSALSAPSCETVRDVFPPVSPQGLQAFASADGVALVWRASPAVDVRGYHVYRRSRGERRRLTEAPITELNFADRTAEPGAGYTYEVTAVDGATPPNESAPSEPARETGR